MFHAINARLARLARRIRSRLAIPFEYATWYGWQTKQIRPGTWQFRDPRFGQLTLARTMPTGSTPAFRTWAQDAIAGRIQVLGPAPQGPGKSPVYLKSIADLNERDQIAIVDGKSDWRWP
jgi:hypothetical protein